MRHLHTINSIMHLQACKQFLNEGDALLLIEDAVYCLRGNTLASIDGSVNVHYLENDAAARAIEPEASVTAEPQTYSGFVQLCTEHDNVINWF